MKKIFLEARFNKEVLLKDSLIKKLPKRIALATTVQFIGSIEKIKKQLEDSGIKVAILKGSHSAYIGQILGCDLLDTQNLKELNKEINEIKKIIDAVLFIGTGRFHPLALCYKFQIPVFAFNPETEIFELINQEESSKFRKIVNSGLLKFQSSERIGIIKSNKKGQSLNQRYINKLSKKYPEKKYYEFITNDIDFIQLNNFNFIECWVNTACPRIAYDDYEKLDKRIVNISDLI